MFVRVYVFLVSILTSFILLASTPSACDLLTARLERFFNPISSQPLTEIPISTMKGFIGLSMDVARNVGYMRGNDYRLSETEAKRSLGTLYSIYQTLKSKSGEAPTVRELRLAVNDFIYDELAKAPSGNAATAESLERFQRGMITAEDAKLKGLPDFVVSLLEKHLIGEGTAGNASGKAHREPFPYNQVNPDYFYGNFITHQRNLVIDTLIRESDLFQKIPKVINELQKSKDGVLLANGIRIRVIDEPIYKLGSPTKDTVKALEFSKGQNRYTLSSGISDETLTPGPFVIFREYHPNGKSIIGGFTYRKAGMAESFALRFTESERESYENGTLRPDTREIHEDQLATLKNVEGLVAERLRDQHVHLHDFMRVMSALSSQQGDLKMSADIDALSDKIQGQETKLNTEFTQRYQLVNKYKTILASLERNRKILDLSDDDYHISFANNGIRANDYNKGIKIPHLIRGAGRLMVLKNDDYEQLNQVVNLTALKKGELIVDLFAGKDKRFLGRLHIDANGKAIQIPDSQTLAMIYEDLAVVDANLFKKGEEE